MAGGERQREADGEKDRESLERGGGLARAEMQRRGTGVGRGRAAEGRRRRWGHTRWG